MSLFNSKNFFIYRKFSPVVRLGGLAPARPIIKSLCNNLTLYIMHINIIIFKVHYIYNYILHTASSIILDYKSNFHIALSKLTMMSTTLQKMVGLTCTSPSCAHSRNFSGGGKLLQVPGISISQAESSSFDSVTSPTSL